MWRRLYAARFASWRAVMATVADTLVRSRWDASDRASRMARDAAHSRPRSGPQPMRDRASNSAGKLIDAFTARVDAGAEAARSSGSGPRSTRRA